MAKKFRADWSQIQRERHGVVKLRFWNVRHERIYSLSTAGREWDCSGLTEQFSRSRESRLVVVSDLLLPVEHLEHSRDFIMLKSSTTSRRTKTMR